VLRAPGLLADFCLSLIDWSSQNVLSVGLGSSADVWCASTKHATVLCDLSESGNTVTSVVWNERVGHNFVSLFLCRAINCVSVKFNMIIAYFVNWVQV
jgi:hypothetical protein